MRWQKSMAAALACMLVWLAPLTVAADEAPVWITDTEDGETTQTLIWENADAWEAETAVGAVQNMPEIGGKGAVLMDMNTGTVLYEKNPYERMPIASVTKIMTLLLVMESIDNGDLKYTDTLTCSETAASMGGSQIWLEPGETMSVDDLLKAVTVVSANDACAMFAEHISGSIEGFVAQMNQRAAQLGMENTKFLDSSGLNDEAYSCAHDVAVMSRALMAHPDIVKYTTIWMDSLRGGESQLVNTNKLVRHYRGATGLKTGTTSTAGHNLSATATRDGLSLVAVILGCETTDERFGGARKMLDYGFANYTVYQPTIDPALLTDIPVKHGQSDCVSPRVDTPKPLLLKKGEEKELVCTVTLEETLTAPIKKGQTVGKATIKKGDTVVATYDVYAKADIPKLTFFAALGRLFALLVGTG